VKARTALILNHPFFGALSLRLQIVEAPGIDTAATDGIHFFYSQKFIAGCSDEQLCGLWAHEVMHCANGHLWRRGSRDLEAWNVATDRAINHHIVAAGLTLPDGALPGEDRAAEALYSPPPPQQQGRKAGGAGGTGGSTAPNGKPAPDPGKCGGIMDPDTTPDAEGNAQEGATQDDWKIATVQAAKAAKMHGRLPACAERLLDELTAPRVDWRTLLADFVTRTARNDYAWSNPNTRHMQRGFILPGLRSNELPEVVIAIDTSGSCWEHVPEFLGAVSDVLSTYPTTAHVIQVDARVASEAVYHTEDLPIEQAKACGGGGTSFRPAFEWVAQRGLTPACLIYLTDLYGDWPEAAPEYPVLWLCTTDATAPEWGETIRID